jgi:hypothetical protein
MLSHKGERNRHGIFFKRTVHVEIGGKEKPPFFQLINYISLHIYPDILRLEFFETDFF